MPVLISWLSAPTSFRANDYSNKTNEITAIPELMMFDIENSIITLDVIGSQRDIA
jgi:hypothetical protein